MVRIWLLWVCDLVMFEVIFLENSLIDFMILLVLKYKYGGL